MPFDAAPVRSPLPDNVAAQSALVLDMAEFYFRDGAQWAQQGFGSETGAKRCLLEAIIFVRRELGNRKDLTPEYLERAIDLKHPQCRKNLGKLFFGSEPHRRSLI